ncbi:hypothetical protein EG68_06401 [Paragonimus skrjabini miyazakii]|uniref:Uncharacterized protein n=1 Tax=Paragonimus skrjabini miyazakii TaxID=59628 RepID=A0A8S9YZP7_9TREM|nr:hypothetical protein EG68_06401 [Paragonimus skrjabini miyazakii]
MLSSPVSQVYAFPIEAVAQGFGPLGSGDLLIPAQKSELSLVHPLIGPTCFNLTFSVEYLVRFKSTYPYPLIQNLSPSGRYILYGVGWIVICLCMIVAYSITRFLLVRHRPRKLAPRSKPAAVKPHPDAHKGKSKKPRKAD